MINQLNVLASNTLVLVTVNDVAAVMPDKGAVKTPTLTVELLVD